MSRSRPPSALAPARPWRFGQSDFPLCLQPGNTHLARDPAAVIDWFRSQRAPLEQALADYGAILLRGFAIPDTTAFNAMIEGYETDPNDYAGGMATRARIAGKVFEASQLPAEQHLIVHQEMAYLPNYPRMIGFYCPTPPVTGGATTLLEVRKLVEAMPRALLASVRERGVLYRRSFRSPERADAADPRRPWTEVMHVQTATEAETAGANVGCEVHWEEDGGLSLQYRSPGFVPHALTGESVWFAQVLSMHVNRMRLSHNYGPDAIDRLFARFPPGRPRPVEILYGDGGDIPEELVTPLYPALNRLAVNIPYAANDVLLLDNLYAAHGRQPFVGPRDVQVALMY